MGKGSGSSHSSSWRKKEQPYTLTSDDLSQMQDKGMFVGTMTEEKYLNSPLGRLDLLSLDKEVRDAFKAEGIELEDKPVAAIGQKIANISYRGNSVDLKRQFVRTYEGELIARHTLLDLPYSMQGKGLSKKIYRAFFSQYKRMGVNRIEMHANIDVGGYAWARYGFSASRSDASTIVSAQRKSGAITEDEYKDAFATISSHKGERIPMNKLADKPYGKRLLLGTDWHAELDMKNPRQVKRFNDYLSGKIQTKNDGEKK